MEGYTMTITVYSIAEEKHETMSMDRFILLFNRGDITASQYTIMAYCEDLILLNNGGLTHG